MGSADKSEIELLEKSSCVTPFINRLLPSRLFRVIYNTIISGQMMISKIIRIQVENLTNDIWWLIFMNYAFSSNFWVIFDEFLFEILIIFYILGINYPIFGIMITVLSENWLEKIGSASKFSPSHWIIFLVVCWQWLSMMTGERAVPHIPSWHSLKIRSF